MNKFSDKLNSYYRNFREYTAIWWLLIFVDLGLCIIATIPVMFLWNWLMTDLFGLKTISLFQSFGLLLLCTFLFKNIGVKY